MNQQATSIDPKLYQYLHSEGLSDNMMKLLNEAGCFEQISPTGRVSTIEVLRLLDMGMISAHTSSGGYGIR